MPPGHRRWGAVNGVDRAVNGLGFLWMPHLGGWECPHNLCVSTWCTSVVWCYWIQYWTPGELGLTPIDARETHVRWEPQEEGVMCTAVSFPSERNQGLSNQEEPRSTLKVDGGGM